MEGKHEFDIILWGATGFVGRQAARHLLLRSRDGNFHWALGGRNHRKLAAVRDDLGPHAAEVPIVTGDSHDGVSLAALAARTKVVCTTVGPYAKYGSKLVQACVGSGTHYCDITGEPHWIRKMVDAHQAEAERTGARIVHACGFDSIPSDLGVFFLQSKAVQLYGKPCSQIKMRVKGWKAGFSGGTPASVLYAIEQGPRDRSIRRVLKEPYSLNPAGQRQGPDAPEKMLPVRAEYDEDLSAWTKPYFMSPINTKIVRRSNAVLGYPYGKDFRYEEAKLVGGGPVGWLRATAEAVGAAGFMLALVLSPTRWLLKKFVLPKSGQGPSRSLRESGFWDFILIGKLADGNVLRARIKGAGDPATESTSRMLVESALCLAQDSESIKVGGGCWTPASAMGELLLARLTSQAGLTFELEDVALAETVEPLGSNQ